MSDKQRALEELDEYERIRKLTECPVCFQIPLRPIRLCKQGHIICNCCRRQTERCPICRDRYSTTRALLAETLIDNCVLPCKFADSGCTLNMRGEKLAQHVRVCDYRQIRCPECVLAYFEFCEYENHLIKAHEMKGIQGTEAYIIYRLEKSITSGHGCYFPHFYLKAYDATFFVRFYADLSYTSVWITMLAPKTIDCIKFHAIIKLHPPNQDTASYIWEGPVNHFRDDPYTEIVVRRKGLVLSKEILAKISPVSINAEWLYSIKIQKHIENDDNVGEVVTEVVTEVAGAIVSHQNIFNDTCQAGGADDDALSSVMSSGSSNVTTTSIPATTMSQSLYDDHAAEAVATVTSTTLPTTSSSLI